MSRPADPKRRDARQSQILKAVEALIVADGLESLTIQGVIRQSGLSAGVVYHHFKNKDAILEALVAQQNRGTGELVGALKNGYATRDILSHIAPEMLADLCVTNNARLNVELAFRAKSGAKWAHMLRDADADLARALRQSIGRDIEKGRIVKTSDPDTCAELIFALWEGLISRAAQGNLPAPEALLRPYLATIGAILQ